MAKTINKLSARTVEAAKKPGLKGDGGGLYLQVTKATSKSWLFRFTRNGKAREMGLGSTLTVSLEAARKAALACRESLLAGLDPIDARDAAKRAQALEKALSEAKTKTFDECALAYIDAHRAGWKNAKHAAQWQATLDTYASPTIGALAVQDIDTELVLKVLEPIWRTKTETASRVRGRIESVLDWAAVRGYRTRENPARWRNNLENLLPERSKVVKVKHHEALPYAEIGSFMKDLRAREGVTPKALEFIILTAARVSEAVNAKLAEIDEKAKVWTVPAERMKAGREHRIPLTDAALKVLKAMKDRSESEYIFPGWRSGKPLTGAACLALLDDMGRPALTVHGFRSTFRDWTAEQSNFPREVAEAALAHVVSDKTEAAYQRGDLMDKRRMMMQAWAEHCARTKPAKVTSIRRVA